MNEEMHKAIRLFNEHSLSVISTDRQINNGTIMVMDDVFGTKYTIHKSGYARVRVIGGYFHEKNHYQLNKVRKITKERYYKDGFYNSVIKTGFYNTTERITLPGQYLELAKMVIRKANKERLTEFKK